MPNRTLRADSQLHVPFYLRQKRVTPLKKAGSDPEMAFKTFSVVSKSGKEQRTKNGKCGHKYHLQTYEIAPSAAHRRLKEPMYCPY